MIRPNADSQKQGAGHRMLTELASGSKVNSETKKHSYPYSSRAKTDPLNPHVTPVVTWGRRQEHMNVLTRGLNELTMQSVFYFFVCVYLGKQKMC